MCFMPWYRSFMDKDHYFHLEHVGLRCLGDIQVESTCLRLREVAMLIQGAHS